MLTMYRLFRNRPSQDSLDTIINNAKKIVSNASHDLKGTGIRTDVAVAFSKYWLATHYDTTAPLTSKDTIDANFNEILLDVDTISKHSISEDARAIYLNVIQEYAAKIKQVYKL